MDVQTQTEANPVDSKPVEAKPQEVKVVETKAKPEDKPEDSLVESKPQIKGAIESELESLRSQVQELAWRNLIKEANVPVQLQKLVPTDLTKATEFLNSADYKALVSQLDLVAKLEQEKAELEQKLNAQNKPQQVETTPIPTEATEPAKDVPKKKWEDLGTADLASIGSLFLNNL